MVSVTHVMAGELSRRVSRSLRSLAVGTNRLGDAGPRAAPLTVGRPGTDEQRRRAGAAHSFAVVGDGT